MVGQLIKNILSCIGIIIGLSASGFLLMQEFNAVPISYASDIDLSENLLNKDMTMKNMSKGDSIDSDLFVVIDKQVEPMKQDENEPSKQGEVASTSVAVEPEPIKIPVKKITVPKATSGTKCPAKKDRPSISSRNNKNHMDEDCCSDYDEWPKPGCAYTAKDFQIMLPGPTKGHVKHK